MTSTSDFSSCASCDIWWSEWPTWSIPHWQWSWTPQGVFCGARGWSETASRNEWPEPYGVGGENYRCQNEDKVSCNKLGATGGKWNLSCVLQVTNSNHHYSYTSHIVTAYHVYFKWRIQIIIILTHLTLWLHMTLCKYCLLYTSPSPRD